MQGFGAHDYYPLHMVSWNYRILGRSQCGFRKYCSTTDHLVSLEQHLRDAFAQRQQAVGIFFDWEKASETTWQYGWPQRQAVCFLCQNISGPQNQSQNWDHTLTKSTQRKVFQQVVSLLWHALHWRSMSCPLVLPRTSSELCSWMTWQFIFVNAIKIHLQQAVNAIQEWATGNVFKFAAQKCKDILFSAPRSRVQRTPAIRIGNKFLSVEESTKFPRTVVGLAPFLYKGHQCAKDTLQGGSEPSPSGRSLEIPEITWRLVWGARQV